MRRIASRKLAAERQVADLKEQVLHFKRICAILAGMFEKYQECIHVRPNERASAKVLIAIAEDRAKELSNDQ